MPMIFQSFSSDDDAILREHIAKTSGFDVSDPAKWHLKGVPLAFYKEKVLLCFVVEADRDTHEERRYFLLRLKAGSRKTRVAFYMPIANRPGEIARANRELHIRLNEDNVVGYLHFYYLFTPQQDPLLRNLEFDATQFFVPLRFADLAYDASAHTTSGAGTCAPICLARGSAWRFLDEEAHERTVPIKFRHRHTIPRVSGRVLVQFRDALFAVDFRVSLLTGVPVLSNPDLLFQHASLQHPARGVDTAMPRTVGVREVIADLWSGAHSAARRVAEIAGGLVLRLVSFFIISTWLASAVFPIFEGMQWPWARGGLTVLGSWISWDWPWTLKAITIIGVFSALAAIFYTTHMDKVFNWILMLCPRSWRSWIAPLLNEQVDRQDRDLNAQDTFRKRAFSAVKRFCLWTTYLVLAFASLQIAEDLLQGPPAAATTSPWRIMATLAVQALLNVPLVYYVVTNFAPIAHYMDPTAIATIRTSLLFAFHAAMAAVVVKGVIRMWVLTVEASPHAFFRRLRVKGDPSDRRRRKRS